ncbi:NADP-dependent glyceraldehyde-3-phosphate dehydrogenase, partial [Ananas comosus]
VVRSGDLVSYTAEEGVRVLGEGKLLLSDSFPGNERNKYCLASKIAPALIAGNALVLKPPTQVCSRCSSYDTLLSPGGFPKGLISCVTARAQKLEIFSQCILGSTLYWRRYWHCHFKEAGMIPFNGTRGKDACIVLEDADLDLVAANIVKGGFSYSGQRCTAVKVVLDALVEKVNAKLAKLKVGPPEEDSDITPACYGCQRERSNILQEYKRKKSHLAVALDHVRPDMRMLGRALWSVIRIAQSRKYPPLQCQQFGLQGCVFTRDINKAIMIADAMETGTVQINSAPARGPDHSLPGLKDVASDLRGN